jgi:hypothetical protein
VTDLVAVADADGTSVAPNVGVAVGVTDGRIRVAVGEGEAVGLTTAVQVGVNVRTGSVVRVGVIEGFAVGLGVTVGVAAGWLPIRTVRYDSGPRFPFTSRT